MKKEKLVNIIWFFVGLLLLFFAWFIYAIYTPATNTNSSRLKDLNWLYQNLGKIPTVLLFAAIGIFICILAITKFKKIEKK
jgi:hypothetical protein